MANSDNTFGTFNKKTQILSQVDGSSTNHADVDAAKSFFYTAEALTVFDECCTEIQWSVVDSTKLKCTMTFGTKGDGDIAEADDWAETFNTRKTALIATPVKSFSISNAVQNAPAPYEVTVTAAGHTFASNDAVKISGVVGMTELNADYWNVDSVDGNTFVIIPASGSFSAYSSGGTVTNAFDNKWANNLYTTEDSTDHLF